MLLAHLWSSLICTHIMISRTCFFWLQILVRIQLVILGVRRGVVFQHLCLFLQLATIDGSSDQLFLGLFHFALHLFERTPPDELHDWLGVFGVHGLTLVGRLSHGQIQIVLNGGLYIGASQNYTRRLICCCICLTFVCGSSLFGGVWNQVCLKDGMTSFDALNLILTLRNLLLEQFSHFTCRFSQIQRLLLIW